MPSLPLLKIDIHHSYFTDAIHSPYSFEDMGLPAVSPSLNPLIDYIADSVHNRAIVHALLYGHESELMDPLTAIRALKVYFSALESDESRGVNLTRGFACEYVAWRFVSHLSGRELIHFLLYELPSLAVTTEVNDEELGVQQHSSLSSTRPLDSSHASPVTSLLLEHGEEIAENLDGDIRRRSPFDEGGNDFVASFDSLNALEIAAVSNAKKFWHNESCRGSSKAFGKAI